MQKDDNKFLVGILVVGFVCLFAWVCHDLGRNKPIYTSTDTNMADVERRIDRIESRLGTMSDRIEQNQKTIESVGRRISTSTGLTYEIIEGTGRAEERLESAIGRSERIQKIIADIENANRQRTFRASQTGVAK